MKVEPDQTVCCVKKHNALKLGHYYRVSHSSGSTIQVYGSFAYFDSSYFEHVADREVFMRGDKIKCLRTQANRNVAAGKVYEVYVTQGACLVILQGLSGIYLAEDFELLHEPEETNNMNKYRGKPHVHVECITAFAEGATIQNVTNGYTFDNKSAGMVCWDPEKVFVIYTDKLRMKELEDELFSLLEKHKVLVRGMGVSARKIKEVQDEIESLI